MRLSLYEYSQLSVVVETMAFGLCLISIGNAKVLSSQWLKLAKGSVAAVLMQVGVITLLQYAFQMSVNYPKVDIALNITMLYATTILLGSAFLPLTAETHLTRTRLLITYAVFLLCDTFVWISAACQDPMSTLLIVASLALYFFELVRIIIVFVVNYRAMKKQNRVTGSDIDARISYIDMLFRCIALLSLFAVMYIFLVMLSPQAKAFYNLAMLLVWDYLFVSIVNLIINYNPTVDIELPQHPQNEKHNKSAKGDNTATGQPGGEDNELEVFTVLGLREKIDAWVADKSYCQHNVTMLQVADQLGTNRTYLSRYVNSRYGCSFNAWLNRLRIEEAKQLLASSPTLPIDQVAQSVGYATKSHFMSSFKSIVGLTPGQWRQQQNSDS